MMSDIPPPTLLSMILCERAIINQQGGSPSLIEIFTAINAPNYPARHNLMTLYFELTNGRGKVNISAELVDVENEEQTLLSGRGVVQFESVHQVVSQALGFRGLTFPHAGEYRFNLYANQNHLLGSRKILCRQITMPQDLNGDQTHEF